MVAWSKLYFPWHILPLSNAGYPLLLNVGLHQYHFSRGSCFVLVAKPENVDMLKAEASEIGTVPSQQRLLIALVDKEITLTIDELIQQWGLCESMGFPVWLMTAQNVIIGKIDATE